MVKASDYNAGDPGLIPGSGRYPGEGNGNPLQYSCQENTVDGGAWLGGAHGVAKSRTRLSDFTAPTVPAESSPFSIDAAVGDAGGNGASRACREQLSI